MTKKAKSIRLKLIKLGNKATTNRYFDSLSVVEFTLTEVNDDGLLRLVGIYKGKRAFRLFYRLKDKLDHHKKVIAMKRDILAEFSTSANEEHHATRNSA